jgi:hypothetical protein
MTCFIKTKYIKGIDMEQPITNVTVFFEGIAKGKRKSVRHSERVMQLDGHLILTPEQFNEYERKAWQWIDGAGFKSVMRASLNINHGHNDGDMTFVQLLPKQKQLIHRG